MTSTMAKRKGNARALSAYQVHVSTILPSEDVANVVDLAEKKLMRLAERHPDEDVRKLTARMLHDYKNGSIAIAWENGIVPIYCFLKI